MRKPNRIFSVFFLLMIFGLSCSAKGSPDDLTYPAEIRASSFLSEGQLSHWPEHLFDGDPMTAWVENKKDWGTGESVMCVFTAPIDVYRIDVLNGYQLSAAAFNDNARIKKLGLRFLDAGGCLIEEAELDLVDGTVAQEFAFDIKKCLSLAVIILDVYQGKKWKDTCLSSFEVYSTTNDEKTAAYRGDQGRNRIFKRMIAGTWRSVEESIAAGGNIGGGGSSEHYRTTRSVSFGADDQVTRKYEGKTNIKTGAVVDKSRSDGKGGYVCARDKITITWENGEKEVWSFKPNYVQNGRITGSVLIDKLEKVWRRGH